MTVTKTYFNPQLWGDFAFYTSFAGPGATALIQEDVAAAKRIRIGEVRVHCSVAFASVQYLILRLSDAQIGSAYNTTLVSQNMNGLTNLFLHYSNPIELRSTDNLVIELSTSGSNVIGIELKGWAVAGD